MSGQLKQAKQDLVTARTTTSTSFQERLHETVVKLQTAQDETEQIRRERDDALEEIETRKKDLIERKTAVEENKYGKERDSHQDREATLELQLQEVNESLHKMETQVADNTAEMATLRDQLNAKDQKLADETRKLREELSVVKDKYSKSKKGNDSLAKGSSTTGRRIETIHEGRDGEEREGSGTIGTIGRGPRRIPAQVFRVETNLRRPGTTSSRRNGGKSKPPKSKSLNNVYNPYKNNYDTPPIDTSRRCNKKDGRDDRSIKGTW